MPAAKSRIFAEVFQDSCDTTLVSVQLNLRPGKIAWLAGVLSFDTNETRVAGFYSFDFPFACMNGADGCNHNKRSITRETELSERAGKSLLTRALSSPVFECAQTRHVSFFGPCCVVADNAHD